MAHRQTVEADDQILDDPTLENHLYLFSIIHLRVHVEHLNETLQLPVRTCHLPVVCLSQEEILSLDQNVCQKFLAWLILHLAVPILVSILCFI